MRFYYFRPGLSRFINNIKILKNLNSLKYVYIFTSASNITGFVSYIKNAIEYFCDCPGFFNGIISKEHQINRDEFGRTIKDLQILVDIINDPIITIENVLIIDDKPKNISNGQYIEIKEYIQYVDITNIIKMLDYYDSDVANKIITSDNMCEWIIDQSMWDDKSNYGDFENMSNSLKTVHTFYILIHDAKINLFQNLIKK